MTRTAGPSCCRRRHPALSNQSTRKTGVAARAVLRRNKNTPAAPHASFGSAIGRRRERAIPSSPPLFEPTPQAVISRTRLFTPEDHDRQRAACLRRAATRGGGPRRACKRAANRTERRAPPARRARLR